MSQPRITRFAAVDGVYIPGQTVTIRAEFDQAVQVDASLGIPMLVLSNGAVARYTAGSGSNSLSFSYTVGTADRSSADLNVIAVAENDARITSVSGGLQAVTTVVSGNTGNDLAHLQAVVINGSGTGGGAGGNGGNGGNGGLFDTLAPRLLQMSAQAGSYQDGETVTIRVHFDETVTVQGAPVLTLSNGREATYTGGAGSQDLQFSYIIQKGDNPSTALDVTGVALNGGSIRDTAGNAATLDIIHSGPTANSLAVFSPLIINPAPNLIPVFEDSTAPTVVSMMTTGGVYRPGEEVRIKVQLSEPVSVNVASVNGQPQLPELVLGITNPQNPQAGIAHYISGSGTDVLEFAYTVGVQDRIPQLNGVPILEAQGLVLDQGGRMVRDAAGNPLNDYLTGAAGRIQYDPLGPSQSVVLDAQAPQLTGLDVLSDRSYKIGDTVDFTVSFDQPVTVQGQPTLTLSNGAIARYVSGSSLEANGSNTPVESKTLTYRYEVKATDASDLDLSIVKIDTTAGSILGLGGSATLIDNLGQPQVVGIGHQPAEVQISASDIAAFRSEHAVVIDTVLPNGSITLLNSQGEITTAIKKGDTGLVKLSFNEAVTLDNSAVTVEGGVLSDLLTQDGGRTWIGTLSPIANTQIAQNHIRLDNSQVTDLAGNSGVGESVSTVYSVDTVIPHATISSIVTDGGKGRLFTIDFGEPVTALQARMLTVSGGVKGAFTKVSDSVYTQAVTLNTAIMTQADGHVTLNVADGAVRDSNGNPSEAQSLTKYIDETAPLIRTVSASNGLYRVGDEILIDVRFSEGVSVDTTQGTPFLSLSNGGKAEFVAATPAGSAYSTLQTFKYTVQPGDQSADLDVRALVHNGAKIQDVAHNDANVKLTPGSNNLAYLSNVQLDGIVPEIVGMSATDGVYIGDPSPDASSHNRVDIHVKFSEAVFVEAGTGAGALPILALSNGGVARYMGGSGSKELTFSYVVQPGDLDSADLDVLALAENNARITDSAGGQGNPASVTLKTDYNNLAKTGQVVIDAEPPQIAEIAVQEGHYKAGSVLDLIVVLDKPIDVTLEDPSQLPYLQLSNQGQAVYAPDKSSHSQLVFEYIVQPSDQESPALGIVGLELNGSQWQGASRIPVDLGNLDPASANAIGIDQPLPLAQGHVSVDLTLPEVQSVVLADTQLKAGESTALTVTFTEAVQGVTPGLFDSPNGRLGSFTTPTSGPDAGKVWTATFTPSRSTEDATNVITVNTAGIRDLAGNVAVNPADADGTSANYQIDTKLPSVLIQSDAGALADAFEDVRFTLNFSEPVTLNSSQASQYLHIEGGTPGTLEQVSPTQWAVNVTPDTPEAGQAPAPIKVRVDQGFAYDLSDNASLAALSLSQNLDGDIPHIVSVDALAGNYRVGSTMDLSVRFSEVVTLQAPDAGIQNPVQPVVFLNNGGLAVYTGGSGTDTLHFSYTMQAGDGEVDSLKALALLENDRLITDRVGHRAEVTLSGDELRSAIAMDASGPTITGFSALDGAYRTGQVVWIKALMNEDTLVDNQGGTPELTLSNGGKATYVSGSGGRELLFKYTIGSGDTNTADLDIVGFNLHGGVIQDRAGNGMDTALTSDFAESHAVIIDTKAPAIAKISTATATIAGPNGQEADQGGLNHNGYYEAGQTLTLTVKFDDVVQVDTYNNTKLPRLTLSNGQLATYTGGSGTDTLTFAYTVRSSDINSADLKVLGLAENGAKLTDTAGNIALVKVNADENLASDLDVVIDTKGPTFTISDDFTGLNGGETVHYSLNFSERMLPGSLSEAELGTYLHHGSIQSGSLQWAADGRTATFAVTPDDRYLGDMILNMPASSLTDMAGNPLQRGATSLQAVDTQTVIFRVTPVSGPFIGGNPNELQVDVYDAQGIRLNNIDYYLNPITGQVDIRFNASEEYPQGFRGEALVVVKDLGTAFDYRDEMTGESVSLSKEHDQPRSMRALLSVGEAGLHRVTVSPLTELAVQKAGLVPDELPTIDHPITSDSVFYNAQVAALFGLTSSIVNSPATTILDADFKESDGLTNSEAYGRVLAALSATDYETGGPLETVARLLGQIENNPETGVLSFTNQGQEHWSQAVNKVDLLLDFRDTGTVADVSGVLLAESIEAVIRTAAGIEPLVTQEQLQRLGFNVDTPAKLQVARHAIAGTVDDGSAVDTEEKIRELLRFFEADQTAPTVIGVTDTTHAAVTNAPISFTVSFSEALADDATIANFAASNGTVTAVTKVDATHYQIEVTPHSGVANGTVSLNLLGGSLTDIAGNRVLNASLALLDAQAIDTAVPEAPILMLGTGVENGATATEANGNPGAVTVTGEAGATITVSFTAGSQTITKTLEATGTVQSVQLSEAEQSLLGDGPVNVRATARDAVGNMSAASTNSFILDRIPSVVTDVTDATTATVTKDQIRFTVTFSEALAADPTLTNFTASHGTVTAVQRVDSTHYTVVVQPNPGIANGTVGLSLVAGSLTDGAGNPVMNASLESFDTQGIDTLAPPAPTAVLGTGVANGATAAEASASTGVVTVTGESGATIAVTFTHGNRTVTRTITGTGLPQAVSLTPAELNQLGDGNIAVSAIATDSIGNASPVTTSTFTLDTQAPNPPALALGAGVADGATAAEATASTGAVTVSGENGASITVTFTNGLNQVTKTLTGTGSPQAVTLSASDLSLLGEGSINVSAVATDVAGNISATTTSTLTLDTTAPAAPSVAEQGSSDLSDGQMNPAEAVTTTFRVTLATSGSAAVAGDTVELLLDGNAFGTAKTHTLTSADINAGYVDFTVVAADLGADGNKALSAQLTDVAGNQSSLATAVSFALDTAAPEAATVTALSADTGRSASDFITRTASQTVSGTYTGMLNAGETIQISTDGSTWVDATATNGTWSASNVSLSGTGTLSVRIVDAAGNVTLGTGHSFTVDTTAPAAPSVAEQGSTDLGDNLMNAAEAVTTTFRVTLATSGSAAVAGDTVELLLDGNAFGTAKTHTLTSADISAGYVDFTVVAADLGADGNKALSAQLTDVAGNQSSLATAVSFVLDTAISAAPSVAEQGSTDLGDNRMNAAEAVTTTFRVTLATSGSAAVAGDTVELLLGGNPFGTAKTHTLTSADITAGYVDFTVVAADLGTDGNKTLSAKITDVAGNQSSLASELAFVLDTVPTQTITFDSLSFDRTVGITTTLTPTPGALAGAMTQLYPWTDLVQGTTYQLKANGVTIATATYGGDNTAFFNAMNQGVNGAPLWPTYATGNGGINGTNYFSVTERVQAGGDGDISNNNITLVSGSTTTTTITDTDFLVNVNTGLTLNASLSAPLTAGQKVLYSKDNGAHWTDISTSVTGTAISYPDTTLTSSATVTLKVVNANNVGPAYNQLVTIDAVVPTASITLSDSALKIGETSTVTITFSEAVSGFDASDLTVANGSLGALTSSDGGITWTGTFTPTANIEDTTNVVTLATTYADVAGNTGTAASSSNYTVDTAAPEAATVTALSADTGRSNSDFITQTATQTVSGTYSGTLNAGEIIQISTDGSTWVDATASSGTWSVSNVSLSGTGTLSVRTVDAAGNVTTGTGHSFTVDTTAPAAPSVAEQGSTDLGDNRMNAAEAATTTFRVTLATSGSAAVAGDTVELLLGGNAFGTAKTHTLTSADITAGYVDFTVVAADLGTDGNKALSAQLTDVAGNQSSLATAVSFALDTTAPEAATVTALSADTGSSASDFITQTATQTVSGTYTGTLNAGETIQISTDGSTWVDATATNGTWSASNVSLSGTGTLSVRTVDAAGNVTPGTGHSFTVDTTAPAAPSVAEQGSTDLGDNRMNAAEAVTTTFRVTLATSGSAAVAGDTVELLLGGNAFGTAKTHTLSSADITAGYVDFTVVSADLGADGNKALSAKLTDVAGNQSSLATAFTFDLDTTAPVAAATVTALSADTGSSATDFITQTAAQTVSGTYTGTLNAGETIQISTDGSTWVDATATNGTWSASNVSLSGTGTLSVRTVDAAGNVTLGTGHSFTVDTTAPAAPSVAEQGSTDLGDNQMNAAEAVTTTFRVTLATSGSAAVAGDTVELLLGGNAFGTAKTHTLTSADITAGYVDFTVVAADLGTDGNKALSAQLTDVAGNQSSLASELAFVLDTVPTQTITFDSLSFDRTVGVTTTLTPTPGSLAGADRQLYPWTDLVQGTTYQLKANGVTIATATYGGDNTAFYNAMNQGVNGTSLWPTYATGNAGLFGTNYFSITERVQAGGDGDISNNNITLVSGSTTTTTITDTDFIVNVNSGLTLNATLDAPLVAGQKLMYSRDGGNWTDISSSVSGTAISYADSGLTSTSTLNLKVVNAANVAGNNYTQLVTIDTVAPVPAVVDTVATDDIINASERTASVTVTGTNEAGATVSVNGNAATVTDTTWSAVLSGSAIDVFGQGSETLTVVATDAAGNQTTTTKTITVDTVAPTVSAVTDGTSASVTKDPITFTVTFTEALATDAAAANFTATNGSVTSVTKVDSTHYTVVVTPTADTASGNVSLSLVAGSLTDTAGNAVLDASLAALDAQGIDTLAPSAPSVAEQGSTDLGDNTMNAAEAVTTTFRVTLPTTGTAAVEGDVVELTMGGNPFGTAKTVTLSASDITAGFVDFTVLAADLGSDGSKSLEAKISDAVGNASALATPVAFTLDTQAPSAPSVAESGSADLGDSKMNAAEAVTTTFRVTLATSGSAAVAGDTVELLLGGNAFGTAKTHTLTSADITAGYVDFTVVAADLGTDGNKALSAQLTDVAGNQSSLATAVSFALDTTAPEAATVTALSADTGSSASDFITQTATQTVSGTYTGTLNAGETIQISTDGSTWVDATATNGTWSASNVSLSGTGTLSVRTVDAAGNVTPGTGHSFTVDTTAPAAPSVAEQGSTDLGDNRMNAAEAVTTTFRVTLATSGSAAVAGDTVELLLGGNAFGTAKTHTLSSADITAGYVDFTVVSADLGADGNKALSAKLTDVAGNQSSLATAFTFDLDTTAPVAAATVTALSADTGSSATDFITQTAAQTVSGTYTGTLNAGETIQISTDGSTWVDATATNGTWSASNVSLSGTGTLSVRTVDAAGNVTTGTGHSYTLDTAASAPTVALSSDTGSSNTDKITKLGTLSVTGTESGATVEYSTDGTTWASSFTPASGSNTVYVRQTDAAGNVSSASTALTFTLDTAASAPTVALSSDTGSSNTDKITNVGTLSVTGTESGATVEYSTDGTNWTSSFTPASGSNTVYVRQIDAAGNVSSASTALTFTLDTAASAPTVALSSDTGSSNTDKITKLGTLSVTGTESGATVEYSTDGTTWASSFTPASGSNTVYVRQTDAAGNVSSASTALTFTLDTAASAPTVALSSDTGSSNTDKITNVGTLSVTGTESGATVEYSTDGTNWTSSFTPASGSNTVYVRQTDAAGNVSSASTALTFTLDTQAPVLPTVTTATSLTNDNTPTISGTTEGGATVAVFADGATTALGTTTAASDGTWSFAPSTPLPDGVHTFIATAQDAAGNTAVGTYQRVSLSGASGSLPDIEPQITAIGSAGEFAVVWSGQEASNGDYSIFIQKFKADGTAAWANPEKLEGAAAAGGVYTSGTDWKPQVTALGASGAFAVTWSGYDSSSEYSVNVQVFNADGTRALAAPARLEGLGSTGNDLVPQIAAVGNAGEFVVTWAGANTTSNDEKTKIFAQKFNASGVPVGSMISLTAQQTDTYSEKTPQVTAVGSSGDFVLTWSGMNNAAPADRTVYVQKFNASGVGGTKVSLGASGEDGDPQVTAVGSNGAYVVVWRGLQNGYSTKVQLFNADGTINGSPVVLDAIGNSGGWDVTPQVAALGSSGEYVVTWSGQKLGGGYNIYVQKFNSNGTTTGNTPVSLEADGVATGWDITPQITAVGSNGAYVVVWSGEESPNVNDPGQGETSIFVQRFNADGTTNGNQIKLEATGVTNGKDVTPQITAIGSQGEFAVTWSGTDGNTNIYVQKFFADGTYETAPVTVEIDTTSPTASLTTASITNADSVTVTSTEAGTAYLVKSDITVTDLASITGAADAKWNSVAITAANTDTTLAATGLQVGTYNAYTVDAAGNISAASTNTVTVSSNSTVNLIYSLRVVGETASNNTYSADVGDLVFIIVAPAAGSGSYDANANSGLVVQLSNGQTVNAIYAPTGMGFNAMVATYTVALADTNTNSLTVTGVSARSGYDLPTVSGNSVNIAVPPAHATPEVVVVTDNIPPKLNAPVLDADTGLFVGDLVTSAVKQYDNETNIDPAVGGITSTFAVAPDVNAAQFVEYSVQGGSYTVGSNSRNSLFTFQTPSGNVYSQADEAVWLTKRSSLRLYTGQTTNANPFAPEVTITVTVDGQSPVSVTVPAGTGNYQQAITALTTGANATWTSLGFITLTTNPNTGGTPFVEFFRPDGKLFNITFSSSAVDLSLSVEKTVGATTTNTPVTSSALTFASESYNNATGSIISAIKEGVYATVQTEGGSGSAEVHSGTFKYGSNGQAKGQLRMGNDVIELSFPIDGNTTTTGIKMLIDNYMDDRFGSGNANVNKPTVAVTSLDTTAHTFGFTLTWAGNSNANVDFKTIVVDDTVKTISNLTSAFVLDQTAAHEPVLSAANAHALTAAENSAVAVKGVVGGEYLYFVKETAFASLNAATPIASNPQGFMKAMFDLAPDQWSRDLVPTGTTETTDVSLKIEGLANGNYKLLSMDLAGNFGPVSADVLTVTGSTATATDLDVDLVSVADISDGDGSTVKLTLDINEAVFGDTVEIYVDGHKLMDYKITQEDLTAAAAGTHKELVADVNANGLNSTTSVDTETLQDVNVEIAVNHGSFQTQLKTDDTAIHYTWG